MKVYPCLSDIIHLAPLFFVLYLLSLPLPWVVTVGPAWQPFLSLLKSLGWIPLALFLLGAVGTGISAASYHRRFMDAFKVPILIFLRHSLYGLGLSAGFFTSIPQPPLEVQVYKVQKGGNKFKFISVRAGKK
jgi:hypothetical protein